MKKLLMAVTAIATLSVATPALADGNNLGTDTNVFTINGVNPPKCNLTSSGTNVTLGANVISDDNGFAASNISALVAAGLNGLGVEAWCTGTRNTIVMTRTALITGDGNQTSGGFNQAVIYDVTLDIPDATRVDGFRPTEGTSDGPGNGPGVGVGGSTPVGPFGPSGNGSSLTFAQELPSAAVAGASATNAGARDRFAEDGNRLLAGDYTGTLTIEVTPGV